MYSQVRKHNFLNVVMCRPTAVQSFYIIKLPGFQWAMVKIIIYQSLRYCKFVHNHH